MSLYLLVAIFRTLTAMIGRITSSSVTEALVDAQASQMEGWDAVMSITGAVVGAVDGAVAGLKVCAFADNLGIFAPWLLLRLLGVGFLPQKSSLWPTFPHFPHVGGSWHWRCEWPGSRQP